MLFDELGNGVGVFDVGGAVGGQGDKKLVIVMLRIQDHQQQNGFGDVLAAEGLDGGKNNLAGGIEMETFGPGEKGDTVFQVGGEILRGKA